MILIALGLLVVFAVLALVAKNLSDGELPLVGFVILVQMLTPVLALAGVAIVVGLLVKSCR